MRPTRFSAISRSVPTTTDMVIASREALAMLVGSALATSVISSTCSLGGRSVAQPMLGRVVAATSGLT